MRNIRIRTRKTARSARLLEERRGDFPWTKEEIEAVHRTMKRWAVRETVNASPLWLEDYWKPNAIESIDRKEYVTAPSKGWPKDLPPAPELVVVDKGDNGKEGDESGFEYEMEAHMYLPGSRSESIVIGTVIETYYYSGDFKVDYFPRNWNEIVSSSLKRVSLMG